MPSCLCSIQAKRSTCLRVAVLLDLLNLVLQVSIWPESAKHVFNIATAVALDIPTATCGMEQLSIQEFHVDGSRFFANAYRERAKPTGNTQVFTLCVQ